MFIPVYLGTPITKYTHPATGEVYESGLDTETNELTLYYFAYPENGDIMNYVPDHLIKVTMPAEAVTL